MQNQEPARNPRAFSAEELIRCQACARPNPPNREKCLYCGFPLGIAPEAVATSQHQTLESETQGEAESAQYIICTSRSLNLDEIEVEKASASVGLSASELSRALNIARILPLSAMATLKEAEAQLAEIKSRGLDAVIISEQELSLDTPAKEARSLETRDDSLTLIGPHGRGRHDAKWSDIRVLVTGHLHSSTFEAEQKPKKTQSRLFAERQLSRDEAVLDIYLRGERIPWRIKNNSFDFSCLGEAKDVTTFKNFASLTQFMRQRANGAEFNDDYVRLRSVLDTIWPIENNEQPRQRRRAGWRELEASVVHASNEAQFDRYSRLLRCLLEEI